MQPKVFILRTAGTNCDYETKAAFEKAGASVDLIHINKWVGNKELIHQYNILAFAGGFSYGDDLGAGTVLANEIRQNLSEDLLKFIHEGKLIIGICNGFQIMTKLGLLPGFGLAENKLEQEATLATNNSGRYDDRWVYLKKASDLCVFTREWHNDPVYFPVAHAEGKFIPMDKKVLAKLKQNKQIIFRYSTPEGKPTSRFPFNPNGAVDNIAGICDSTGRILGMMPHPERFQDPTNHPRWRREKINEPTDGMMIFINAVNHVKENL
jgi:phosphoribosylformylglycinamidine synthase